MIAYLDSSAIVKLYNAEDGSEIVRTLLHEADFVATCMAAYPEVRSALARGFREGLYDESSHRQKVSVFLRDWSRFQKVALAPDGRVFAFAGEAGTFVFEAARGDAIFADGFD